MLNKPRRRGLTLVIVLAVIAGAVGGYVVEQYVSTILAGSKCQVGAGPAEVSLDPGQAAIAATIAGVAYQHAMPARAVVVAYAAAIQESDLRNLHYGDRDSVGVFQQRPSQGWGPASRLEDPVYATTKFFEALASVPGYLDMPVSQAAQAVQRSANGAAYNQYLVMAGRLSAAFTGREAHAVWCWQPAPPAGKPRLTAAHRQLVKTFGPAARREAAHSAGTGAAAGGAAGGAAGAAAATLLMRVPTSAVGWSVADWLVTHAARYQIHEVRYEGLQWRAAAGQAGWTADSGTVPAGEVQAG